MRVIDDFHDAKDCAQIIEAGRDTQMNGKVCVAVVATVNVPRTNDDTWLDQCADARLVALVKKINRMWCTYHQKTARRSASCAAARVSKKKGHEKGAAE